MTWMGTTPREASSIFIEGVMDTDVGMNEDFRKGDRIDRPWVVYS